MWLSEGASQTWIMFTLGTVGRFLSFECLAIGR